MARKNPWIGLASYDENSINSGYKFCGRQAAILEVFSKVDNNVFTTLYGKSGIGKTSLIRAGLFPKLKANGYFPVHIRLGLVSDGKYAEFITDTLAEAIATSGGECSKKTKNVDASKETYLWNYFRANEFHDQNGQIVFPVIVLDQFEEIYFKKKQSIDLLLKQLYLLIDDTSVNDRSIDEDYTNYRILVSLREDDLFRLEDSIDHLRLPEMKYNRHRLVELNHEDARSVIIEPGYEVWSKDSASTISDMIINFATEDDGGVNTAMLSLVCSRLYDLSARNDQATIDAAFVSSFIGASSQDFFISFYNEVKAAIGNNTKCYYIEDNLITDDGRRRSVPESEFKIQVPEADFLFEGEYSLLRYLSIGTQKERHVEIIHDTLAKGLLSSRTERHLQEAAEKQRKRNRIIAGIEAAVIAFLAFVTFQYYLLKRTQNDLIITQSRYIVSEVNKLLDEGLVSKAKRLLLYALPENIHKPDRPYVAEAGYLLEDIELNMPHEPIAIIEQDNFISKIQFSPSDKYIVAAVGDSLKVYDKNGMVSIIEPIVHDWPLSRFAISPDERYIATSVTKKKTLDSFYAENAGVKTDVKSNADIFIWDFMTGKLIKSFTLPERTYIDKLEFSADASALAANDGYSYSHVWDIHSGEDITYNEKDFKSNEPNQSLFAHPHDSLVYLTGTHNNPNSYYTINHDEKVYIVELSHSSKELITVASNTIYLWRTSDFIIPEISLKSTYTKVKVLPDKGLIMTASTDGSAQLWDVHSGRLVQALDYIDSPITDIDLAGDKILIVSGGDIIVWKICENTLKLNNELHIEDNIVSIGFTPDGTHLTAASNDTESNKSTVKAWNLNKNELTAELHAEEKICHIEISPDGSNFCVMYSQSGDKFPNTKYIQARYWGNDSLYASDIIRVYGLDGKELTSVNMHPENGIDLLYKAIYIPDGENICLCHYSGQASLLNIKSGILSNLFKDTKFLTLISKPTLSADGKYLFTPFTSDSYLRTDLSIFSSDIIQGDAYTQISVFDDIVLSHNGYEVSISETILGENTYPSYKYKSDIGNTHCYWCNEHIIILNNGKITVRPIYSLQTILDKYNNDTDFNWSLTEEEKRYYHLQ